MGNALELKLKYNIVIILTETVDFIKPIRIAKILAIDWIITRGHEAFDVWYPPIIGLSTAFINIPPNGPAKHIKEYNNVIFSCDFSCITLRIKSANQKCKHVFNPCNIHRHIILNIYRGSHNKNLRSEKNVVSFILCVINFSLYTVADESLPSFSGFNFTLK